MATTTEQKFRDIYGHFCHITKFGGPWAVGMLDEKQRLAGILSDSGIDVPALQADIWARG